MYIPMVLQVTEWSLPISLIPTQGTSFTHMGFWQGTIYATDVCQFYDRNCYYNIWQKELRNSRWQSSVVVIIYLMFKLSSQITTTIHVCLSKIDQMCVCVV